MVPKRAPTRPTRPPKTGMAEAMMYEKMRQPSVQESQTIQ